MAEELYYAASEPQRQRLRELGWHEVGGLARGRPLWRRPDGAVLDEEEAFRQLAPVAQDRSDAP